MTTSPNAAWTDRGDALSGSAARALAFAFATVLLLPLPIAGEGVRLSDLALVGAPVLTLGLAALWGLRPIVVIAVAGLVCLSAQWLIAEIHYSAFMPSLNPLRMIFPRWFLAIWAAALLAEYGRTGSSRTVIAQGMVAALALGIASIAADGLSHAYFGKSFIVPEDRYVWSYTNYRAGGILGHPNGAAIAGLAIVPLIIGVWGYGSRPLAAAGASILATGVVFHFTQTRGATLSALVLIAAFCVQTWRWRVAAYGAGAAMLGLLVVVALEPIMGSAGPLSSLSEAFDDVIRRFADPNNLSENTAGRADTVLQSFDLSLDYPLGMGSAYGPALEARTGFTATHNGFLQLVLLAGWPMLIAVAGAVCLEALRFLRGQRDVTVWLALYLVFVSFFESLFYVPFMPLLFLWVVFVSAEKLVSGARGLPARAGNDVRP